MERVFSEIYASLDASSKKRYREKLDRIQDAISCSVQNPYLSDKENVAQDEYPLVELDDICSYLINVPSLYMKNEFKDYKRLVGYRYLLDLVVTLSSSQLVPANKFYFITYSHESFSLTNCLILTTGTVDSC